MPYTFDWDEDKAAANLAKHGVSFDEAKSAFYDPLAQIFRDDFHSNTEERLLLVGYTPVGRLLFVIYTERGETFRIISARPATRQEKKNHENNSAF